MTSQAAASASFRSDEPNQIRVISLYELREVKLIFFLPSRSPRSVLARHWRR